MLETRASSSPQGDVRLRDGRRLAYAEYGRPDGRPVLFFHGTPGSRLFHHPDNRLAVAAGARIIAIDRPGFGRSDFKPGRRIMDWPGDVLQIADALSLGTFAILGYSSGGAYAAACAAAIPDRLTAIALVSSIAFMESPEMTKGMHGIGHVFLNLDRHCSPLARLGTGLVCHLWRDNPEAYFKSQLNGLEDSEAARALTPGIKSMLTEDFREAVRNGTRGITLDLKLLSQPWGFQPGALKPEVLLWHGEVDSEAPLAMGKRLARTIPRCRATFLPNEGHWAIYVHWPEILAALLPPAATASGAQTLQNLARTPPSISTLSDPSADSGQGLPPGPPGSNAVPPNIREADPLPGGASERRKLTMDQVIKSQADAPPEVAVDVLPDPAPATDRLAPMPAVHCADSAPAAEAADPAPDAPPAAGEVPAPGAPVAVDGQPPPAETPAAPAAVQDTPSGNAPELPPDIVTAAEDPAPGVIAAAEGAPISPARRRAAAREGKARAPAQAGAEAGQAASRKARAAAKAGAGPAQAAGRKARAAAKAAGGTGPAEKEAEAPAPTASKAAAAADKGKGAPKPVSRSARGSGEHAAAVKAAGAATRKTRPGPAPAGQASPEETRSAPEAEGPAPRTGGSGRKPGREPVHA